MIKTICENCSHKKVCSYVNEFKKLTEKSLSINETNSDMFSVDVNCKEYRYQVELVHRGIKGLD